MAEPAPGALADEDVEERLRRVEQLLGRLERSGDPAADEALAAVAALSQVYGAALARVLAIAGRSAEVAPALARDELVRHLLLLHDLRPGPTPGPTPGPAVRGRDVRSGRPAAEAGRALGREAPAFIPLAAVRRRPGGAAPAARPDGEACELCGEQVPGLHRHLLDSGRAELLCACHACTVLFSREAAGQGRYLLVPDRRRRLTGLSPAGLGAPVGLAFFVRASDGTVAAHYPSPVGATRWEIDPERWDAAVVACPELAELAPDVEAVLLNTARGRADAWLTPIDDCYRLVAVVRQHWEGLSGGDRVWPEIERFFDGLRGRDGTHPGRPGQGPA